MNRIVNFSLLSRPIPSSYRLTITDPYADQHKLRSTPLYNFLHPLITVFLG